MVKAILIICYLTLFLTIASSRKRTTFFDICRSELSHLKDVEGACDYLMNRCKDIFTIKDTLENYYKKCIVKIPDRKLKRFEEKR